MVLGFQRYMLFLMYYCKYVLLYKCAYNCYTNEIIMFYDTDNDIFFMVKLKYVNFM